VDDACAACDDRPIVLRKDSFLKGALMMAVQVEWDSKVCSHSGNCVKTLPQVFKVENKKFVIDPSGAADEKVIAAVKACPSGALKIRS
jgi:uncharacterized Fe-S cluster protein YjdI